MIDQTFSFGRILLKNLYHIQVLTFDINGQSRNGTLLLLLASAFTKICQKSPHPCKQMQLTEHFSREEVQTETD